MDVFTGVHAFYNEFDISGEGNSFEPSFDLEVQDSRPFNSAFVKKDAGMQNDSATLNGYMAFEDPGTSFMNNIGTKVPVTVCYESYPAVEQGAAMFFNSVSGTLTGPVEQGQLYRFSLSLPADSPIVVGTVLGYGNKTASGNTAAGYQRAAVAAGQTIFAAIHCPVATTGTLDVVIESDDNGSFSSATTQLTFTQITTTATAEFISSKSTSGITDTYWRARWTGASTPDHTFVVVFGVA